MMGAGPGGLPRGRERDPRGPGPRMKRTYWSLRMTNLYVSSLFGFHCFVYLSLLYLPIILFLFEFIWMSIFVFVFEARIFYSSLQIYIKIAKSNK
jgi:hypothetical protein